LGCKNDLYLVTIERHIKENPKFHKLSPHKIISFLRENLKLITSLENNLIYHYFQNDLKLYMILGNVQSNHPFHLWNSIKQLGSLQLEFHIGLYTLYGCQIEIIYIYIYFSVFHSCLKISLSKVLMYMFFGNIFQIIKFESFINNLCWCYLYQNGFVGIRSILSILSI
jgi:hypothetical protein